MKFLFLALALLLGSVNASFAQYQSSDPQAPVKIDRFHGNVRDFATLSYICRSEIAGDYLSNALCTAGENEVREGARRLDMEFKQGNTHSADDEATVYIHIASAGRSPRAVSVMVEVSRYYEAAVDREAPRRAAGAFPRPGKLVMYQEFATASGSGDDLENALRRAMQGLLRRYFADAKDMPEAR